MHSGHLYQCYRHSTTSVTSLLSTLAHFLHFHHHLSSEFYTSTPQGDQLPKSLQWPVTPPPPPHPTANSSRAIGSQCRNSGSGITGSLYLWITLSMILILPRRSPSSLVKWLLVITNLFRIICIFELNFCCRR